MQPVKSKITEQKADNLFMKMMGKYLTYWPLFLLFLLIAFGAAYAYLRYTNPKYEATASLIIKDEKKGNEDSKLMESINLISSKKIIENEIEVLQSRPILNNVVKKLHLYAPIYQEGKIKPLSAYLQAPVTIEAVHPDSLVETDTKINFNYDASDHTILLNNQLKVAMNEWIQTPYGTLKFTPNNKYVATDDAKQFYFIILEPKNAAEIILNNLKVTATNKLSSIVNLKYRDDKPELAENILNELIASYNHAAIAEKNSLAKNTLSFIEDRLNIVGADLDTIEQKIQQYKAGNRAVDIGTQGQLFLQNVSLNDQKLSEVNMQISVINQLEKQVLENNNGAGILPSTLGVGDPTLSELMNSLNTAELERERLKKTVAENNPLLVSISDQINKIKPTLLDYIKNQRQSLQSSKANLYATNNSYNNILHTIPVKERQLLEISRDQNIKSGIYSFLLQKREESELAYAATISDSRVVNYAQSSNTPVSPNRMLVAAAAILAALGIPISVIGAKEALNPTILYRQEIETLTSIPIIGEVAFNKSGKPLVVEAGKRSFIAEEFRKIRFSLLYLGIGPNTKKLLITSSISGEGKSFVAANLAISYSLTGKRVVLVDLDLHNSSLGKIFNPEPQPGVSDYLTGDKHEMAIINSIPTIENLYFISSGSSKEDPSVLLENGRVQRLIAYLDSHFDMVIIDTAPVVLVTDAHVLSACCNATLYVVRHKYTPKMLLKRFDENNEINPLTNPAIIFNGVKTRGYIKNNYGHGYGYVYGDKYISAKKRKQQYAV